MHKFVILKETDFILSKSRFGDADNNQSSACQKVRMDGQRDRCIDGFSTSFIIRMYLIYKAKDDYDYD